MHRVILSNQLIGAVVDIGCGIGAAMDTGDVSVIVVFVGISDRITVCSGSGIGGYLGRGGGAGGRFIGVAFRQDRITTAFCDSGFHSAESVVGIFRSEAANGRGFHSVVRIIGVGGSSGRAVGSLDLFGQVVQLVILVFLVVVVATIAKMGKKTGALLRGQ